MTNLTESASIVTDFELAAIKAFQHHFPNFKISGCLFHFGQCLWRQLQADAFSVAYNTDAEFAKCVKRLMALAFVPVADVVTTFEELTADGSYRQIESLVTYFEENFIGRLLRRNRCASPRYDIAL